MSGDVGKTARAKVTETEWGTVEEGYWRNIDDHHSTQEQAELQEWIAVAMASTRAVLKVGISRLRAVDNLKPSLRRF